VFFVSIVLSEPSMNYDIHYRNTVNPGTYNKLPTTSIQQRNNVRSFKLSENNIFKQEASLHK